LVPGTRNEPPLNPAPGTLAWRQRVKRFAAQTRELGTRTWCLATLTIRYSLEKTPTF
jgi:hypothetical protein